MKKEYEISKIVVDSAIEVHRTLGGPGLLESVSEESLAKELELRNIQTQRQVALPIYYKKFKLAHPLRIDMVANKLVIIECKATTQYNAIYESQVLTYLRLTGLKLGLVINFGEKLVKNGISRVVNGL
jgi:GxxExxY protein